MLQFKEDPQELMSALDRFLSDYYGDRQVEFKPSLAEISAEFGAWRIPDSLKVSYSFAQKSPGLIDIQDSFFINNGKDPLNIYKGRLYIHESNIWGSFPRFSTKIDGEDPPVWVEYGREYEPRTLILVGNSLSQFLATFSLKEALFGKYFYNFAKIGKGIKIDNLLSAIEKEGYEVYLLWEINNYWKIVYNRTPDLDSFYSVEDTIFIGIDGFCATNHQNADRLLSSIINQLAQISL